MCSINQSADLSMEQVSLSHKSPKRELFPSAVNKGFELLNLLKSRCQLDENQEVPMVAEEAGQQLMTNFYQSSSKPKDVQDKVLKDLSNMYETVACRSPKSPKSPAKVKKGRVVKRLKLKVATPQKAKRLSPLKPSWSSIPLDLSCEDKENVDFLASPPVIEPQAKCFRGSFPMLEIDCEDKETDDLLATSPVVASPVTPTRRRAPPSSLDSVVGEMMKVVQKVKREAREVKENAMMSLPAEKRSLPGGAISSEPDSKRRCQAPLGSLWYPSAPVVETRAKKGLRV